MFFADNYLTSAPVIPSGQFASNCLYDIFYECRSLYSITAQFTDWGSGVNATEGWTISVAENGTFYKPSTLSTEYGENRIPSNWTVVDV
ncbi:MAG: hypothetical protein J6S85_26185 [Methanobrevibacter sp.]|nr:hypothetical protein [Methanobrevibacter sp.]MBO7717082.1 hypothetical protein [Methanobrevibacter sp.]